MKSVLIGIALLVIAVIGLTSHSDESSNTVKTSPGHSLVWQSVEKAAYETCYGLQVFSPATLATVALKTNPDFVEPTMEGCRNANLDIAACVLPERWATGDSPVKVCERSNGVRYLTIEETLR